MTQSAVPAPTLLLHSSLRSLLLTLEVRLGEGLHGGQEAHLAHLPAQRHRRLALLAAVEVHDEIWAVRQCQPDITGEIRSRNCPQLTLWADFPLPGESDQITR